MKHFLAKKKCLYGLYKWYGLGNQHCLGKQRGLDVGRTVSDEGQFVLIVRGGIDL